MRKISCVLKWCAVAICIALPIVEAGYWITDGYPFLQPFVVPRQLEWGATWQSLDSIQRLLGFLVNLIPIAFSVLALSYFAKLFQAFEYGNIFERGNVVFLKQAGWMLIWGQISYPLYSVLLSLILTYRNPVGERMVSIAFKLAQFEILLVGLAIMLASWIFERAVELREESEGTI